MKVRPGAPASGGGLHPGVGYILILLAGIVVTYPLLGAGMGGDDWFWLALVRHLDHPFAPYVEGILHEYFYRPSSILLWWLIERAFGSSATGHYAINLTIHFGIAVSVALLLCQLGAAYWRACLAAIAFVVMPAAIGTVAWLSNRNELLAVLSGIWFLVYFERARLGGQGIWLVTGLAAISLTSKETGLIFILLALLRLILGRRTDGSARHLWIALVAPVVVFFIMRKSTLLPVGIQVTWEAVRNDAMRGIFAWVELLPAALTGFNYPSISGIVLTVGIGVCVLATLVRAMVDRVTGRPWFLIVGLAFVALPPLLQWPITQLVLTKPEQSAHVLNLRFYYLASAGLAMILAGTWVPLRHHRLQTTIGVVAAVSIASAMFLSWRISERWRESTDTTDQATRIVASTVLSETPFFPLGCTILLARDEWPGDFIHYADMIVKAIAPRDHPVLGCALFTSTTPPWHALLRRDLCEPSIWPATRHAEPFPLIRPIGNLCLAGFALPPADSFTHTVQVP